MANGKKSWTMTVSWILLCLIGAALTLGGFASIGIAYFQGDDPIGGATLEELSRVSPDLPNAIRGRRSTAAFLAVSTGMLILWIAPTAYRRGEKWAWWALLTSVGLGCVIGLLRIPMLNATLGAGTPGIILAILLVALALSYPRRGQD